MFSRLVTLTSGVGIGALGAGFWFNDKKSATNSTTTDNVNANNTGYKRGFVGTIGNTPLIKLEKLSQATGCTILAKAEHLNPGGSIKDRAAFSMIENAQKNNLINTDGSTTIIEATGGNTGIALALICNSLGYNCAVTLRNNLSQEKRDKLKSYGANVIECDPVDFSNPKHYYHTAQRMADENNSKKKNSYFFINQFENIANSDAHYKTTGPEIWSQCDGNIDYVAITTGTGGTLGGLSNYFKDKNKNIKVINCDIVGSGVEQWINNMVSDDINIKNNAEKKRIGDTIKARVSGPSIAEGTGIGRITKNLYRSKGYVDKSICITNEDIIQMCYYLLYKEGIYVGPSAAANVIGAVKVANMINQGKLPKKRKDVKPDSKYGETEPVIVTVLCDSGNSYQSRIYNRQWLEENNYAKLVDNIRNANWQALEWT